MRSHRLVFREIDRDKFDQIRKGKKKIEIRAFLAEYALVAAGDTLTFACGEDEIIKEVAEVRRFRSLDDMLRTLPLSQVLPSARTRAEARRIYLSFPGYRQRIKEGGLLVFYLAS